MAESFQVVKPINLRFSSVPAVRDKTALGCTVGSTKSHLIPAVEFQTNRLQHPNSSRSQKGHLLGITCSQGFKTCSTTERSTAPTAVDAAREEDRRNEIDGVDHLHRRERDQPGRVSQSYDVVILSNGPGEVAAWVKPVVKALRARFGEDRKQLRISVVLSPCPHASQQEAELVRSFPGVDRCQEAQHFSSLLLWGQTVEGWDWRKRGISLFLGGDQFNALLLGWRLGYKTVLYAEESARWPCLADLYCLRDASLLSGVPSFARKRCQVVGDLFVAAVTEGTKAGHPENGALKEASTAARLTPSSPSLEPCPKTLSGVSEEESNGASGAATHSACLLESGAGNESSDRIRSHSAAAPSRSGVTIGILPGSKPVKLGLGVPYFLAAVDHIHAELPAVRFVLPLAPTVTLDQLATHAAPDTNPNIRRFGWASASVHRLASSGRPRFADAPIPSAVAVLTTPGGARVEVFHHFPAYDVFRQCDLCLTTIGTNTAELGSLAVPMIVALPTHSLEVFRGATGGLGGLLARLPGPVGDGAARAVNAALLKSAGFIAWPNRWAGEAVVPELIGRIEPREVAAVAVDHVRHPARLKGMHDRLQSLNKGSGSHSTHGPGAAEQIAQCLEDMLASE